MSNRLNTNGIFTGSVHFERIGIDGNIISAHTIKNRIVQSGLNLMASLLSNTSSYRLKSIGVGSGQAITTINDTTLTTPTWKDITFTSNTNIVTGTTLFGTNEANHLIGEFGLRDTNNILFARTLNERDIYTKVTGEQLRVTWSINVNYGGNL